MFSDVRHYESDMTFWENILRRLMMKLQIEESLKHEMNKICKVMYWAKENINVVLIILVSVIMTYGYELTHFVMSIDDERSFSRGLEVKAHLGDARYTAAAWNAILPHKTLPFWPDFLFVLLISLVAICFAAFVFHFSQNKMISALSAAVFVSMPIHAYNSMFSMACIGTPIGYLLCFASVYCVYEWYKTQKTESAIWAFIYAMLMHGEYQALTVMYIALACFVVIGTILNQKRDIWRAIIKYISILLSSLIAYWILLKVIGLVFPSRGYVESLMAWGTKSFMEIVEDVIHQIVRVNVYPVVNRGYNTIPVLNVIWLIALIAGLIKVKGARLPYFLAMFGLEVANNIFFLAMGGFAPPRVCFAMPIFAGVVVFVCFKVLDKKIFKNLVLMAACLVVLYQSATVVELNYMDSMRQTRDLAKVERVSYEIEKLGLGTIPNKPVAFIEVDESMDGYWYSDNTFALSYFTLGIGRLQSYFERVGYPYRWCSEEELQTAKSLVITSGIPKWPQEGSVVDTDELIIVNFGAE